MSGQKVIRMKKRFRPNLAFFIFLLIVIYIIILGWNYLTKEHISIYEVNTTQISDDPPLYGFILRSEEIFTTDTEGYVNYYNAEGSRVGVGNVVFTVDQNGEVTNMLERLQTDGKSSQNISAVREAIASFQNSFRYSDYQQINTFSSAVNSILFEQSRENLYNNLNRQLKSEGMRKDYIKGVSKKSGIIVYSIDGYENTEQKDITSELFDSYASVTKKQLQTDKKVPAGTPVYKLITGNDWSLIVKLNDSYYEQLSKLDYVRVTITKDNMSFNAAVTLFDQDGTHFAKLQTSRYMEHYINDRFLKLEFSLQSASGLKIPNSSILNKDFYVLPENVITDNNNKKGVVKQVIGEDGKMSHVFVPISGSIYVDGKYYVNSSDITGGDIVMDSQSGNSYIVSSKQSLPGVYCVNQGYCEFRPIEVTYQNKEYTIVSDTTNGGLSAYDHIVVDPSHLSDDDFIE